MEITVLSQTLASKPPTPRDFLDPIRFLATEHHRQQVTFGLLRCLADAPDATTAKDDAASALASLREHLPTHIADEERDLFPMLKRACEPEDQLEAGLAMLSQEHETDKSLVDHLVEPLNQLAAGERLENEKAFAANARAFAELQERHLAWENAFILPLASKRLSEDDKATLGRHMAERRGLSYPN